MRGAATASSRSLFTGLTAVAEARRCAIDETTVPNPTVVSSIAHRLASATAVNPVNNERELAVAAPRMERKSCVGKLEPEHPCAHEPEPPVRGRANQPMP